jgi:dolichol-phosphate mannosyltransferase
MRHTAATLRAIPIAVAATRLARAARQPPTLQPAAAGASISVVVPARNEAARIGPLLDALSGAPEVGEVIVVDDQSTDGTASIAQTAGARVVTGCPHPPGWVGKGWVVQQGVAAATAEWIVTLDADTRPDPSLPAALVARLIADSADFATVAGRFECPTPGSRWLHAAMLTTLVYRFGPPGGHRRGNRLMANGQCMAFRNGSVDLHPVAGHTVEDVALARHLAATGRDVRMYDGAELLTTRMYEDIADTWHGWSRSLALPGVEPRSRQLAGLAVVVGAQVLPVALLTTSLARRRRPHVVEVIGVAFRLGTLGGTRRAYTAGGPAYWASPLADAAAAAALVRGIVRRHQTWRGRTYRQ